MQGRGRGTPPTHAAAAVFVCMQGEASRLVPVTLSVCVSMRMCRRHGEGQGQDLPQPLSGASGYEHPIDTSRILALKISYADPSKGGNTFFLSSASIYQFNRGFKDNNEANKTPQTY